jgi:hypothetical protein
MEIEKIEYLKLRIRESLYFYILKDYSNLKNIDINKIEIKIYLDFINYLSKEYKKKDIENIKEDYIYFEIESILFNIIEDNIY